MSNDDWAPSASWTNLRLRAALLRRVRSFFDARGFLEVETPLLSSDTVVDRHLDPIGVVLPSDPRLPTEGRRMWLQTSPEFGMKRLMAGGAEAIYQITRAFRTGECGPLHNPEFTIVEWYRRGDSMRDGMHLLSDLAADLLNTGPAEMLTYCAAFSKYAGVDPLAADMSALANAVAGGPNAAPQIGADRDAWLDFLLVDQVAPKLGRDRPVIVHDFPASQAMLAQVRNEDPPVAERFELFYRGIELANGYHELLDADELRRRNATANEQRVADGKPSLPADSRLLDAMDDGLPPCTGVALGFDRVVMLAAGAGSLADVTAFPVDRA